MMELLIAILIASTATAYITQYLLLVKRDSHFGYLSSRSKVVKFPAIEIKGDGYNELRPEHTQPVMWIDYVRRIFRAFKIEEGTWIVTSHADVWTCSFCLSFWIAFGGTAFVIYTQQIEFPIAIATHFSIAFIAQKLIGLNQEGIAE